MVITKTKVTAIVVTTVFVTTAVVELTHKYFSGRVCPKSANKKRKEINASNYDEDLIKEQLARNYAFYNEEGMEKICSQHIVVVGVGGVGSWVATMLVRSGIRKLRIIDFDQVSLSSLNRHAVATLEDVGISKVEVLKEKLSKIAPWCEIEAINSLWEMKRADELLSGDDIGFVVDCIDNIDTKVDLLTYCVEKQLRVISSMGAGCKSDPTRINIGDLSNTEEDPLARSVRRRLKKRGIISGLPVVFSSEKPDPRKASLLPLPEEEFKKGDVDELSALQNFRSRILPVMGTMPGVFGLTIASYILNVVSGYPIEPIEGKNRYKVYDGILQSLAGQQSRIGKLDQRVPIAMSDINYIVEEMYRGKSPISNYSTRLTLSRWDPKEKLSYQNVVLMTKEEQKIHEDRVLNGGESLNDVYSKEIIGRVEQRFKEEEFYSKFR